MKKWVISMSLIVTIGFALTLAAGVARADSIDVLVGDKDGFGMSCPDTGTCPGMTNPIIDNRSAAETAATSGAQYTDIYSSIFPGYSPNTSSSGDILFPFLGTLTSATITFAAGDLQSTEFGPLSATIDGVSTPFFYQDGRDVTAIHSITLTASEITAANMSGVVDLNLNRDGSGDFVDFDWFELTGTTASSATPEPASVALVGGAFATVILIHRRRVG